MKQENITKLQLARTRVLTCPDKALQNTIITLINSVLLDENGAGAVLAPYGKETVFECQACFTIFTGKHQNPFEQWKHLCPSCWCPDLKTVCLQER